MAVKSDFTAQSLVLVTGANGHVAQHLVSQLLSRPESTRPRVRGTVRSDSAAAILKDTFRNHFSNGMFEVVQVADIKSPGAFDKAIKGCTHVAHVASPLVVNPKDTVNDLLKPAIEGTLSLLKSATSSDTLQAVVITSSFAACFDPSKGTRPGYAYTSSDWSPLQYDEIADPNLDLKRWPATYQNFITYLASKKLAERAAWDYYEDTKPKWYLTVINPTYIGGPCILPLANGTDSFSYSNQLLWSIANSKPEDQLPKVDFPAWIDVRDVAKAHIQALTIPSTANHRYILTSASVTYTEIANIVRKKFQALSPSKEVQSKEIYTVDGEDARIGLEMGQWIDLEKTVVDTVNEALRVSGEKRA